MKRQTKFLHSLYTLEETKTVRVCVCMSIYLDKKIYKYLTKK